MNPQNFDILIILPFILSMVIPILIIAFICKFPNWEEYRTLLEYRWMSPKKDIIKIKYDHAFVENDNIVVEFIQYKVIQCTDKNNQSHYIKTKLDNSTYFKDKRFIIFMKICNNFNENTTFEDIANILKEKFNISETKDKKRKNVQTKKHKKTSERIIDF